jgi:hypothetical protein
MFSALTILGKAGEILDTPNTAVRVMPNMS